MSSDSKQLTFVDYRKPCSHCFINIIIILLIMLIKYYVTAGDGSWKQKRQEGAHTVRGRESGGEENV